MGPQETDKNPVVKKLRDWDAKAVTEVIEYRGETTVVVPRESLRRACEYLCTEPSLRFSLLADITPTDRFPMEPRFEINYHLVSLDRRERIRLKVRLPGNDPTMPSASHRCGPPRTGTNAKPGTFSAFALRAIPTCAAS